MAKTKKVFPYLGFPQAPDTSHVDFVEVKGLCMPEKMLSAIRIESKADLTRGVIDRITATYNEN